MKTPSVKPPKPPPPVRQPVPKEKGTEPPSGLTAALLGRRNYAINQITEQDRLRRGTKLGGSQVYS